MPPENQVAPWKIIVGYAAFSVFTFFFMLYLTFPYDALKGRIAQEANAAGLTLRARSVGPGLFGITFSDVQLSWSESEVGATPDPSGAALAAGTGGPLKLDSMAFRPSLFPLGLAIRASALEGVISGAMGGLGGMTLRISLDDLDPGGGNMKGFSGMDLSGRINGSLILDIPRTLNATTKVKELDFTAADGSLQLNLDDFVIKGGTVMVPMYGESTPIDLPRVAFGNVEAKAKLTKGVFAIEQFKGKSEDLELLGSGDVKLAKKLGLSALDLQLKLRTEQAFIQRLGAVGMGLSVLPSDPALPNFKLARITGYLSRPNLPLGR
jgi:type II secretion system protein N